MDEDNLQFDRAESSGSARPDTVCTRCNAVLDQSYYEANGKPFCPSCRDAIEADLARKTGSFPLALALGIGGALVGALLYFAVAAITGYEVGLVAIACGWLVGRGVQKGADGRGGRKFQVAAVVLTYFSIATSYFALAVKDIVKSSPSTSTAAADRTGPAEPAPIAADSAIEAPSEPAVAASGVGGLLVMFAGLPLIAAFGDLPGGLLSLLIIAIGLRQAWQMNARLVIEFLGPFEVRRSPPSAPA